MNFKADIYLRDETNRIGCGWRRVMLGVGPKWIRVEEIASGRKARILRKQLDHRTKTRFDVLDRFGVKEVR